MTDKERILMRLVQRLAFGASQHQYMLEAEGRKSLCGFEFHRRQPEIGDLVIAESTRMMNDWVVGWVAGFNEPDTTVIREIGSDRLCDYSNESWKVLTDTDHEHFLEGKERKFYEKVCKAFARGGEYQHRYGGLSFDGATATITVREVWDGHGVEAYAPVDVVMKWNSRTTINAILQAMEDAGYGNPDMCRGNS